MGAQPSAEETLSPCLMAGSAIIPEVLSGPCEGLSAGRDGFRAMSRSCVAITQGEPESPQGTVERGTAQRHPASGCEDMRECGVEVGVGLCTSLYSQLWTFPNVPALSGSWILRDPRHLCKSQSPGRAGSLHHSSLCPQDCSLKPKGQTMAETSSKVRGKEAWL